MSASVRTIAAEVAAGATSAETVLAAALERMAAYDKVQPQVWIEKVPPTRVLEQARRVDARVRAGERPTLAGVPFAVKDNLDVAGLPTTAACPAFAYTPKESAEVVRQLERAGAVLVGKTNLDQFATGLSGTRSPYGAPGCVFNLEQISGGSSSGSAAAVAAGLIPLALGSDTAGSGRVPAAFNGIVGFKPTRGRWSTRGLVPACRSLDCVSVFTADSADAALVDAVLAGLDAHDPFSRSAPPPTDYPARIRLGVPAASTLDFFGDRECERLFAQALEALGDACELVEVDIAPLLAAGRLLYEGPWVAERAAALEPLFRSNPAAIHPVVRAIVQAGAGLSAVEAFRGQYALAELAREAGAIWTHIDVLATPTAPCSWRIAEMLAEPFVLNARLGAYTSFVNLLDLCAIALPAGFRSDGAGFGISLVAAAWGDAWLLGLGAALEPRLARERPPLDLAPRARTVELAVVGAHLHGMPLHWQLASRGARLVSRTRTAPAYRLYAMADASPPKPALAHVGSGGASIELEVYALSLDAFGAFVAEVPPPLAIGTVELETGAQVKGFVAEPRALQGAADITRFGGWRAFMKGEVAL